MPINLTSDQMAIVSKILDWHLPDQEIRVFGSRNTEKVKPFSDLDLVVMTSEPLPFETLSAVRNAFSDSNLPFRVDILDWSLIEESFQAIILKNNSILKQSRT